MPHMSAPVIGKLCATVDFMKFIIFFILLLTSACATTNEQAAFRAGSDSFDTSTGIFERRLCLAEQDAVQISIHFDQADKVKMLEMAKTDISEGSLVSDDLEPICISSYPFEVMVSNKGSSTSTTCFSLLSNDQSRFVNFIKTMQAVKSLPKSNCKYY